MVHKIIVALLSTLVLSVILASLSYTPKPDWDASSYYFSFPELMMLFALYSGPCFLLGGVPLSFLIDAISRRRTFSSKLGTYFFNFLLYALAAVPAIFVFILVLAEGSLKDLIGAFGGFLLYGVIGSLLYYHLSLLTQLVYTKITGHQ